MTAGPQRRAVINAVARELEGLDLGRPVRVAVDGITGVGKTTFADELAGATRANGRESLRVSMDGFHHLRATRYRQGRESAAGYYEDGYDVVALRRELLEPLGESGDRRYRTAVIDLAADQPVSDPPKVADEHVVLIMDGSFLQRPELDGGWDRTIFLRSTFDAARARGATRDAEQLGSLAEAERIFTIRYHAAQRRYLAEVDPESRADIVIEHDDPQLPVFRSHRPAGAARIDRVDETREFFGPRADGWNERFAEDGTAFTRAIEALAVTAGEKVLDLGCGAGPALPELTHAVSPRGTVVGLDLTPEMLHAARVQHPDAPLVLAAAEQLPLADGAFDVIFAAGLISHLENPVLGLVELARASREGARLAIFHPVGRAALAEKHGRELRTDDVLDPANLGAALAAAGWSLTSVDDAADRYFALATRVSS